ncbi:hypothetical protein PHLGIDRAFT_129852 [Phlebiopsis gigantea 11061_1 CR5-6]|uniref:Uncharacterized protein n=1 Tax=Phlebiopsis gigantea (strain 11061_1 CR5-6) TaxID=745531 RepID=A0A0C3S652_PHLG1|nr:hypothetical protein PHLGIDRAFT_129852 [Phlebiopsis gigantea 11061_1 CR5-6]
MSPHTRPRPILKRQLTPRQTAGHPLPFAICGTNLSPHVHFPPTPGLVASTHPAHSPRTYDRKPIILSPNPCELPPRNDRKLHSPPADFEIERRERGRPRWRSSKTQEGDVKGSYFHPRAFEACEPEPAAASLTSSSVERRPYYVDSDSDSDEYDSDSNSDSDDSDAVTTPPDPRLAIGLPQVQSAHPPPQIHHPASYITEHAAGLQLEDRHEGKSRPQLIHAHRQSTITIVSSRDSDAFNEGCLGGF